MENLSTRNISKPKFFVFLKKLFDSVEHSGHSGFILKPAQIIALEQVFLGKDTLVLLPTGYGKSLIFQILPWLLSKENSAFGTVLVVSPLNALMADQINGLRSIGVPVGVLGKDVGLLSHDVDDDKRNESSKDKEENINDDATADSLAAEIARIGLSGLETVFAVVPFRFWLTVLHLSTKKFGPVKKCQRLYSNI